MTTHIETYVGRHPSTRTDGINGEVGSSDELAEILYLPSEKMLSRIQSDIEASEYEIDEVRKDMLTVVALLAAVHHSRGVREDALSDIYGDEYRYIPGEAYVVSCQQLQDQYESLHRMMELMTEEHQRLVATKIGIEEAIEAEQYSY